MLKLEYKPYTLDFKFDAGTSRGIMTKRPIWFIKINETGVPINGFGEVAPLNGLSKENPDDIEDQLASCQQKLMECSIPESLEQCQDLARKVSLGFPSVQFGVEMALIDLFSGGQQLWFDNFFTKGDQQIPINGLIWMGQKSEMIRQVDEKIDSGFQCIKLKIGALDFNDEIDVIKHLRKRSSEVVVRLDANGGLKNNEALRKLKELSAYDIHSIEQPILPRQPEAMNLLCKKSEIPIALDEELIGISDDYKRIELLETIEPQFIVLKPSLLGGFRETLKWIEIAESHDIGWWITSALESNLGLNAISQFTSQFSGLSHQGLGTGQLFNNNLTSPLYLNGDRMMYDPEGRSQLPF